MKKLSGSLLKAIGGVVLLATASSAFATETFGDIANLVSEPVDWLTGIVYKICYLIGFVLVIGSFLQYKRYRMNPTEVRLSQPVAIFIIGLAIGLLPLLPQWLSGRVSNQSEVVTPQISGYQVQ